jgi:ribosomal protein L10
MKFNKKNFQLKLLKEILESQSFFGFLSVNSFTVKDKIELKIQLKKLGFDFKVLKNGLLAKVLEKELPQYKNMEALSQGFSIIIYSIEDSEIIDLSKLKGLAKFLKNESNLLFLGGLYDDKLINKAFMKDLLSLKSSVEVYSDLISTMNQSQFSLINSMQRVPASLVHCVKSVNN